MHLFISFQVKFHYHRFTSKEDADAHIDLLTKAFDEDGKNLGIIGMALKNSFLQILLGILDTVKEVAVGWSSDGASVMLGRNMKGGAAKKFEKMIGKKLHKTWVSFMFVDNCISQ